MDDSDSKIRTARGRNREGGRMVKACVSRAMRDGTQGRGPVASTEVGCCLSTRRAVLP